VNIASSVLTWMAVLSVGLAVVAGGFLGVRTARDRSEPTVAELVIVDPELLSGPPVGAFSSAGGFSGFGSAALGGEVLGSGELVGVELLPTPEGAEGVRGTVTIRNGSRELTVRFLSTLRLFEVVSLDELVVGDAVVVRSLDGEATSVLRVPVGEPGDE
jgi:hypothetical protein